MGGLAFTNNGPELIVSRDIANRVTWEHLTNLLKAVRVIVIADKERREIWIPISKHGLKNLAE